MGFSGAIMTRRNGCGVMIISRVLALVCVWRSGVVAAAAGRENYNAYNYDLTTPLLTPDGRILQVEYASMAPSHSSPLVAIQQGTHMILATLQRKPFGGRIVTLPTGVSSSSSTVVVGVSGILSDGMSLVQEGRQALVSQYCTYGESSFNGGGGEMVSKRVAQAMGNACQGRAMGGGLRAYGASLLVVGSSSTSTHSCFTVSLVHPSGAVTSSFPDDDRVLSNSSSPKIWMVGGDKGTQTKLKQQLNELLLLEKNSDSNDLNDEPLVAWTMKRMVQALIQQYQQDNDDDGDNHKKEEDENEMEEDLRPQSRRQHPILEMVVVRPNGTVNRLTESQANILVQSAMESLSSSSSSS
jgi:20S proteasome alpha/beta subunit